MIVTAMSDREQVPGGIVDPRPSWCILRAEVLGRLAADSSERSTRTPAFRREAPADAAETFAPGLGGGTLRRRRDRAPRPPLPAG